MAFTYDPTTDVGKCRLMLGDTDSAKAVFQDAEWEAFLALGGGNLYRAKGHALLAVAANRNLRVLVMTTLGLQTDGAATAREFRLQAQAAFDRADAIEAQGGGLFDIAEWAVDDFSYRELLTADRLRSGI
jgi:hypothetical protein